MKLDQKEVKGNDTITTSTNSNANGGGGGGYVVQKQVKSKILQAQQEEALFVSTSSALQSKMEKVQEQLSTNASMNGYHIGLHFKNSNNNNNNISNSSVSASPPIQCPSVSQDHQQNNQLKQPQPANSKPNDNGNIASAYFQAKYGYVFFY